MTMRKSNDEILHVKLRIKIEGENTQVKCACNSSHCFSIPQMMIMMIIYLSFSKLSLNNNNHTAKSH